MNWMRLLFHLLTTILENYVFTKLATLNTLNGFNEVQLLKWAMMMYILPGSACSWKDSFFEIRREKRRKESNDFNESISSSGCTSRLWSSILWFISIWVVTVHWPSELQIFQNSLFVCLYLFVSRNNYWFLFLYLLLLCLSVFFLRYDHRNKIVLSQFGCVSKIQPYRWIDCLCPWHCFSHHRIFDNFFPCFASSFIADCPFCITDSTSTIGVINVLFIFISIGLALFFASPQRFYLIRSEWTIFHKKKERIKLFH